MIFWKFIINFVSTYCDSFFSLRLRSVFSYSINRLEWFFSKNLELVEIFMWQYLTPTANTIRVILYECIPVKQVRYCVQIVSKSKTHTEVINSIKSVGRLFDKDVWSRIMEWFNQRILKRDKKSLTFYPKMIEFLVFDVKFSQFSLQKNTKKMKKCFKKPYFGL